MITRRDRCKGIGTKERRVKPPLFFWPWQHPQLPSLGIQARVHPCHPHPESGSPLLSPTPGLESSSRGNPVKGLRQTFFGIPSP